MRYFYFLFLIWNSFAISINSNSNSKISGRFYHTDLDKLRYFANQWTHTKNKYDPLYSLRIIEAVEALKYYYLHFEHDNIDVLIWKRNQEKYIILVSNNDNIMNIEGLLEHPDNVYNGVVVLFDIKDDLKLYAKNKRKSLNFTPMFKWSHGLYFRDILTIIED